MHAFDPLVAQPADVMLWNIALQTLIHDRGKLSTGLVVVTHDPRILKYADRVCELENGRLK